MDIVDSETRSRMMSGIRAKDTRPELLIRSHLHKLGFRYRLHCKNLAGKPDIVLKKYRAVVFIHGCFWHRHKCHLFKWPKTRSEFWKEKINGNRRNDIKKLKELRSSGWRVCTVWECATKGKNRNFEETAEIIAKWIKGDDPVLEISG